MSRSSGSISSSSSIETHITEPQKAPAPEISLEPPRTDTSNRGRPIRPRPTRAPSSKTDYPPDDARAMSPRRGSEETEVLEYATRCHIREQARQLQLSLLEIAESIELVKADHDKLEKQNLALQDYIGGLTRSMSKGQSAKRLKTSNK